VGSGVKVFIEVGLGEAVAGIDVELGEMTGDVISVDLTTAIAIGELLGNFCGNGLHEIKSAKKIARYHKRFTLTSRVTATRRPTVCVSPAFFAGYLRVGGRGQCLGAEKTRR
jgi:hypothetical protein